VCGEVGEGEGEAGGGRRGEGKLKLTFVASSSKNLDWKVRVGSQQVCNEDGNVAKPFSLVFR
jgi:hypothetical protein